MQTLCHCSRQATVTVHGLLICAKCEDFLARHPALESTLLAQWKTQQAEQPAEPSPEVEA